MSKLSVIIPVYNTSKYLPLCIASLTSQKEADVEFVCVNDGSTDNSLDLLKTYASKDDRIKIVDKKNGGLSSARNAGIRAASGDILAFVDSDDYVEPSFADVILSAFDKNNPDVLVFGAYTYPKFFNTWWTDLVLSPRQITYNNFTPDLITKESSWPFAWRMAVRAEFLREHDLEFDEDVAFGEDTVFQFEAYPLSSKTVLIPDRLYNYRISRPDSLMDSHVNDKTKFFHDHIRIVEHISKFWNENGFSKKWGDDLLEWSLSFVGFDVLKVADPDRTMLMNYLATVWKTYFSPRQLDKLLSKKNDGPFVRAILSDRASIAGIKRKKMFYFRTLKTEGITPFIENASRRAANIGPVKKTLATMAHAANRQTSEDRQNDLEKLFEAMDAKQIASAKELLES